MEWNGGNDNIFFNKQREANQERRLVMEQAVPPSPGNELGNEHRDMLVPFLVLHMVNETQQLVDDTPVPGTGDHQPDSRIPLFPTGFHLFDILFVKSYIERDHFSPDRLGVGDRIADHPIHPTDGKDDQMIFFDGFIFTGIDPNSSAMFS